jgi:circadian clock protein KaiB
VEYSLCLYVSGTQPRCLRSLTTLKRVCDQLLPGGYELEVVDIYQQPHLAKAEHILAVPTLIKLAPAPQRRIIGDLSNRDRLVNALGLGIPNHHPV